MKLNKEYTKYSKIDKEHLIEIRGRAMPQQQKSIYASLFSTVLIFTIYFWYMAEMHGQGAFDGENAYALIGQSVLWLMVGGIVVNIIAHIAINIIYAIITNEANSNPVVDERDKLIELRALRVAYYVFGAGFVLSMISLALGQPPFIAFIIIIFSCAIASLSEGFVQLFLYRRGF